MKVSADDGRIYLPKDIRKQLGVDYELINRGDHLILVPIPDDPLEELRKETSKTDKSATELKESALKEALEEAGN